MRILRTTKGLTVCRFLACFLTMLIAWTLPVPALAQVDKTPSSTPRENMTTDRTLGISFQNVGYATKRDGKGYVITLQAPRGTIRSATAGILLSQRRVIDLSGSYGGPVYLDTPMAASISENRVKVDSFQTDGLWFRREYWAVYAGMGAWEGVINCTAFMNGQYYVLSLHADIALGKPGEVAEGERMSAEHLRDRVADVLSDGREPVVRAFNALLSSFHASH